MLVGVKGASALGAGWICTRRDFRATSVCNGAADHLERAHDASVPACGLATLRSGDYLALGGRRVAD